MFKIKKGLDIPISGKPSNELTDKPTSNNVGIIASDYVGMKPTMLLKILIEERSVLLFQWKLKRIH